MDKIKPRSAAMHHGTGGFVVCFSLFMSLWFFWRTLFLPEIQQHARYLAMELEILNNPDLRLYHKQQEVDIDDWLKIESALNMSPIRQNILQSVKN